MTSAKRNEPAVEAPENPPEGGPVKPTADMTASELKNSLAHEPDKDLHPSGDPKRSADQTSASGGEAYPEDPPMRTTKPDVPILRSLATGAGAHVPPDPDKYTPDGRPK